MTMRKLSPNDILPLIADYLEKAGLPDIAEQLTEYYDVEDQHPIKKYSLVKVIKFYISNKKKLLKHFIEQEVEEEQDEQKQASEKEEQEEIPQKKEKQKKNKKIVQQEVPQTQKQSEKKTILLPPPTQEEVENEESNKKRFFQKCDDNMIHSIRAELRDNTFEAKAKFGKGDAYGELGNEKLKFTKGDMFKKEKGKLKNRQFQGNGQIDMYAINSIKL